MYINNIGYNHYHNADFCINRPQGSGDYLFVLLKTPAVFTFEDREIISEENSFILFKKGSPQHYRAHGVQFSNDWVHLTVPARTRTFSRNWISLSIKLCRYIISTIYPC